MSAVTIYTRAFCPYCSRAVSLLKSKGADFNEIDAGGVVINDVPSMRVDSMPYGGVKDSGLGREGIRFAMEDMTEIRLMVLHRIGHPDQV